MIISDLEIAIASTELVWSGHVFSSVFVPGASLRSALQLKFGEKSLHSSVISTLALMIVIEVLVGCNTLLLAPVYFLSKHFVLRSFLPAAP